jgi:hypothetical protein
MQALRQADEFAQQLAPLERDNFDLRHLAGSPNRFQCGAAHGAEAEISPPRRAPSTWTGLERFRRAAKPPAQLLMMASRPHRKFNRCVAWPACPKAAVQHA